MTILHSTAASSSALQRAAQLFFWGIMIVYIAPGHAAVDRYSFGEPCRRPPKMVDSLPAAIDRFSKLGTHELFEITFNNLGVAGPEWCVFFAQKMTPKGNIDAGTTFVCEASPDGWKVSQHHGDFDRGAFLVFEPETALPLLVTTRESGEKIYPWKYKRWNPQNKWLEPALPANETEFKRFLGRAVVMYLLNFPLGVYEERQPPWGSHPLRVVENLADRSGARDHLDDLLGEALLVDVNKPMDSFDPHRASDFGLALAIDRIHRHLEQYDRAIEARIKGGPVLGAIGGPSLRVFNDTGVLNGIAIANEFTRRYPKVAEAWWLRAKMAEWALYRGLAPKLNRYGNTDGATFDLRTVGIESLHRYITLRGWTGRPELEKVYPFNPPGLFLNETEYWDHRRALEFLERMRHGKIDTETLGNRHLKLRVTDGLVRASSEMRKFKP